MLGRAEPKNVGKQYTKREFEDELVINRYMWKQEKTNKETLDIFYSSELSYSWSLRVATLSLVCSWRCGHADPEELHAALIETYHHQPPVPL